LAFWLVLLHANYVKNTRHSGAMPVFFALLARKITSPILPTYYFAIPKGTFPGIFNPAARWGFCIQFFDLP